MLSIYKDKKVFVTGHTGFKGSWLTCLLDVVGARYAGFSLDPNTAPSHYELLNKSCQSTIGNIANFSLLSNSINSYQPEILFHLAAQPLVRESYKNPVDTYQTNVMGTMNVLEAVRKCPSVRAVVIVTTDKVYENKEWLFPYRENDELGGYDIYSSSKAAVEILTRSYQRSFFNVNDYKGKHNTLIATARAGNVIGGGDWSNDRLIPDLVKNTSLGRATKIRNPEAVRPWQHVLDCIHGYLLLGARLLNEEKEFAEAWNFAPYSFESKTVQEIALIGKSIWPEMEFEFEKPTEDFHEAGLLKLDNTKSITKLQWKPRWDTETAVAETIEWYRCYYRDRTLLTNKQIENFLSL